MAGSPAVLGVDLQVNTEFDSFDEFRGVLDEHERNTYSLFSISDSRTVGKANQLLPDDGEGKFQEKFKYSYIRYRCKHGGTYASRGKGDRPNQR
jgi:hypothetical protein